MTHEWLGLLAGALELSSLPIYVYSIFCGKTKPSRVTWWVLAIVTGMITLSYYASGARETIWLPAAYTLSFAIVAILSLRYGDGPFTLSLMDRLSLVAAAGSGIVWFFAKSPVPALFMNICTEFAGLVPTMYKAYYRPWTESRLPWAIGTAAAFLNILAIDEWSFVIAAYPLYIFASNAIITAFLFPQKKR